MDLKTTVQYSTSTFISIAGVLSVKLQSCDHTKGTHLVQRCAHQVGLVHKE